MSLDVMLVLPNRSRTSSGIFIRENGQNKEISREEWGSRFPNREPVVIQYEEMSVYHNNITHNLNSMATEAGLYYPMWRPETLGFTHAHQLVESLTNGLALLQEDPERFAPFAPENAWGTYAGLVEFTRQYLEACIRYPNAEVYVSR